MTSLKKRFLELLQEEEVEYANEYHSERLKKQLNNEWQDISFIPQPGMSDFVCSNKVCVGEALKKAHELVMLLKEEESDNVGDVLDDSTEDSIIQRAVGVLRRRIEAVKDIQGEYHSPGETSVEELKQESPAILTNPRDAKACQKLLQFDVLRTLSLTILAYLHAFSCYCVQNLRNPAKFTENSNL